MVMRGREQDAVNQKEVDPIYIWETTGYLAVLNVTTFWDATSHNCTTSHYGRTVILILTPNLKHILTIRDINYMSCTLAFLMTIFKKSTAFSTDFL
jgi:hypothetical protein